MALSHLTDLLGTAKARILAQYTTLVARFIPELAVLIAQVQELEDNFWTFFTYLDLDVAPGVWLDRLAALVGQTRGGLPDDSWLLAFTKARIIANRTKSDVNDLLLIVDTATKTPGSTSLVDEFPAAMCITTTVPMGGFGFGTILVDELTKLIRASRAIAVGCNFLYQPDDDTLTFMCGDAGGGAVVGLGFDDASAPDDPSAGTLAGAVAP